MGNETVVILFFGCHIYEKPLLCESAVTLSSSVSGPISLG